MQIETYSKKTTQNLIEEAKSIAIIPSLVVGTDAYCAAVGLYYMLNEKYDGPNGKNIKFIYSGKTPEGCEGLISDDEITSSLNERDLLVTIDYSGTNASKVRYSTDNDVLYLKIGPVPKNFDLSNVRAKIIGFDFDLIIIVGAQELQDLGPMYSRLKDEIHNSKIITIDNTNKNRRFGVVNIIDNSVHSLSQLVFSKSPELELTPNTKAAKALLTGITYTNKHKV